MNNAIAIHLVVWWCRCSQQWRLQSH